MSAMTRIVFILVVVAFAALDGVAWADSAIAVTDEIASLDSRTPPGGVKESTDGHRAAETQMRTIVLQLVLLFLTFALALGAMLYVQRLEWQKQDLQKQIDDIEVQENCLIAVEKEIIEKSGAWYGYGTDRLGQGRENTIEFLKENKDLALEIKNKLEISGEQDSKKKKRPEEKTTKGVSENSQKKGQKKK